MSGSSSSGASAFDLPGPQNCAATSSCTIGTRVEPPTNSTKSMSDSPTPAACVDSFSASTQHAIVCSTYDRINPSHSPRETSMSSVTGLPS